MITHLKEILIGPPLPTGQALHERLNKARALAADFLVRRGQRPIVVLIDASSFNGPTGTNQLAEMLRFLRVPVRTISRGDDPGEALPSTV